MGKQVAVVLHAVAMVAVIVGVDFVFFRNRFWERLTVNIGIVLVFAAFYLRFFRRPPLHRLSGPGDLARCACWDEIGDETGVTNPGSIEHRLPVSGRKVNVPETRCGFHELDAHLGLIGLPFAYMYHLAGLLFPAAYVF